jgi:hypothetical protein
MDFTTFVSFSSMFFSLILILSAFQEFQVPSGSKRPYNPYARICAGIQDAFPLIYIFIYMYRNYGTLGKSVDISGFQEVLRLGSMMHLGYLRKRF